MFINELVDQLLCGFLDGLIVVCEVDFAADQLGEDVFKGEALGGVWQCERLTQELC